METNNISNVEVSTENTGETTAQKKILGKAGLIVLICTLASSLFFYIIGGVIIALDNVDYDDYDGIYGGAFGSTYNTSTSWNTSEQKYLSYTDTWKVNFNSSNKTAAYIFVDNATVNTIQYDQNYTANYYLYDTNVYKNGTYYDYCYRVSLITYESYTVTISGNSSTAYLYISTSI
jgi:hypothetical protein